MSKSNIYLFFNKKIILILMQRETDTNRFRTNLLWVISNINIQYTAVIILISLIKIPKYDFLWFLNNQWLKIIEIDDVRSLATTMLIFEPYIKNKWRAQFFLNIQIIVISINVSFENKLKNVSLNHYLLSVWK